MEKLEERVQTAQTNTRERDQLLGEYLPFIRKQISGFVGFGLEYEDLQSIAMLVFVNCIRQYNQSRGTFLSFAAVCIKNRLLDELRKQKIYQSRLLPIEEEGGLSEVDSKAVTIYNRHQEQEALKEEIERLTINMESYGVSFQELSDSCPKQKRSRLQCNYFARLLAGNAELTQEFLNCHRLPRAELARLAGVSEKTIEKHRKYIVALTLILLGDYPGIVSFLP